MTATEVLPNEAIIIEGGGSHTSVACYVDGAIVLEFHGVASNPRSVSDRSATDTLEKMLLRAQSYLGKSIPVYAAHGAASTVQEAELLGKKIIGLLGQDKLTQVVVVNDLVPVALSRVGSVFVAAAGTGTGYLARSKKGVWHRASGLEFILADEGGGFDLGQSALRAVVKELDDRGKPTLLTDSVAERLRCDRSELGPNIFGKIYQSEKKY